MTDTDPSPDTLDVAVAALHPSLEAILVEEAPSHRPALQTHLPIRRWGGFFTMASGGLGYSLPAAVGIRPGSPDPPYTRWLRQASIRASTSAPMRASGRLCCRSWIISA